MNYHVNPALKYALDTEYDICHELAAISEEQGINLKQLEAESGLKKNTIRKIFINYVHPKLKNVLRIAHSLGYDLQLVKQERAGE